MSLSDGGGSPKRKKRRIDQKKLPSLPAEKHEKENTLESDEGVIGTPLMFTIFPDAYDGMAGLEAAALLLTDIDQTKEGNFSEKSEESEQINKLVR